MSNEAQVICILKLVPCNNALHTPSSAGTSRARRSSRRCSKAWPRGRMTRWCRGARRTSPACGATAPRRTRLPWKMAGPAEKDPSSATCRVVEERALSRRLLCSWKVSRRRHSCSHCSLVDIFFIIRVLVPRLVEDILWNFESGSL